MNLNADSIAAADSVMSARADSLRRMERIFGRSESSLRFPGGDFTYLFPAYRAMEGADSACVHVFHYGDSQIEGDRITQIIRDSLQSLFGGAGPGMIPLWQPIACRTVSQTLTDSVATFYAAGIMGRRATHDRYGAMAQMAEMRGERVTMRVEAWRLQERDRLRRQRDRHHEADARQLAGQGYRAHRRSCHGNVETPVTQHVQADAARARRCVRHRD